MKALAYTKAHSLEDFSIVEVEVPPPELRPHDLRVDVRAFSVNPVDYKIRSSRSGAEEPVILGWDGAGVVAEVGPQAKGFAVGYEVYFAGDLTRAGTYAEEVAVDARIVAKKPARLDFAEAAALPLTALTAWEALVDHGAGGTVLVIAGAGGVGSIAIQLAKAKLGARVIATASRPETIAWCRELGADHTVDHRKDIAEQLTALGIDAVDFVFSTTQSDSYIPTFAKILRPFGQVALIDDPKTFDILPLKRKSISVHWELMFTKTLYAVSLETQGAILQEVAALVDAGKLRTTMHTRRKGFTAAHVQDAHRMAENGQSIGKTVIERA